MAKVWQDQVEGDRFMAELRAGPFADDLAARFDVPVDLAREMAGRVWADEGRDPQAVPVGGHHGGGEWEPGLSAVSAACVVFWGALDPACQIEFGRKLGASLHGSEVIELDCNHWPVLQRPAEVAEILERRWRAHAVSHQVVPTGLEG
ncbi:hypothetical protein ABZX77_42585 [Streptomyces sp. NPDC004237]|uniref:alpha/beta fold hydrolase n=1 Tax=Streptomyces sp. NPDC004237 TaxID=3154455 RepID=UPI0033A51E2A